MLTHNCRERSDRHGKRALAVNNWVREGGVVCRLVFSKICIQNWSKTECKKMRKIAKTLGKLFAGLALAAATGTCLAQAMLVNVGNITVTTDGSFGGCMMKISPINAINDQAGIPPGIGAGQCSTGFLSLDCDGNHISSKKSNAQLTAAQLAYVSGKTIYVVVDSSKKNNSYCLATRIDNMP